MWPYNSMAPACPYPSPSPLAILWALAILCLSIIGPPIIF